MSNRYILVSLASAALLLCAACGSSPGRSRVGFEVTAPDQVMDFDVLYANSCAGCHGEGGKGGASIALADPVFLAIADDATIRRIATNGVPGTPMPAFAQSAGGMLTEKQIDALVGGIRSWAQPDALGGAIPPSYASKAPGDAQRGADVFRSYCSSCHGTEGRGGSKVGSIVEGSYLALISDQDLRTNVIVGRPAWGAPDWRGDVPGKPMSEQEVSDVVAWLVAQRPAIPGQPYPKPTVGLATGGAR